MDDLMDSSQLIIFRNAESPEEAVEKVAHGKADAAWIFPDDMARHVEVFVADPDSDNAFIRVVQREEKVMLMLSREKLGGVVFDLCAERIYLNYLRQNLPQMDGASDQELLELYENTDLDGDLFNFEQTDGASTENDDSGHYLMTPVRGLLAVVIVLCGIATAMYYIQDSSHGIFAWMPQRLRPAAELGCQLVSVVNVSVAALVSLAAIGLAGSFGLELLVLVMYSLCVAVFSMTLRRLCGGIRGLSTLMPLLVVVMLLVCPVFFDLGALRQMQYLFPPTYYINAVHNEVYLLYMLIYTLIAAAVYYLAGWILRRE
jgi:ABC-2 type transport system permease protein